MGDLVQKAGHPVIMIYLVVNVTNSLNMQARKLL